MKKVIFLCLLSLSVCLSKPAADQAAQPTTISSTISVDPKAVKTDPTPPAHITESQASSKPTAAPTEQKTSQNVPETTLSTLPPSPPKNTDNSKPATDNKTTDKQPTSKDTSSAVSNATTEKINNDVKPTEKAKDEPSTEKVTTKPTEAPKTTEAPKSDADKHVLQARGFDGASFIGGIILTLGLLAIGFMGFKYYKNQTERNYHTL